MNKKPNVIYILADDMGYGDISAFNENCPFTTPNFDAMCENGLRFTICPCVLRCVYAVQIQHPDRPV